MIGPRLARVLSRQNCIHPHSHFLRLTTRCNQCCVFCNIRGGEAFELGAAEAARRVEAALAADPEAVLHLTGGEPTLRRDLFALAELARARGAQRLVVQTNAVMLATPGFAPRLTASGATDLIVSFHAADADASDALTRAPGTFERTRRGIAAALAAGLRVLPNVVFSAPGLDQAPGAIRAIARDFPGAGGIILSTVQPHGLAGAGGRAVVPPLGRAARAVARAIDACSEVGLPFHLASCENPLCFILAATGESAPAAEVRDWVERSSLESGCRSCRLAREMAKDKVKPKACAACPLEPACGGVWKRQLEIHGPGEVQPYAAARRPS